ncbi:coenzyme Q-binding protein COQ10, mitochondrial isoform X2 [Bactrocera dorsalis]|uniref:Coenzyme Q-binding protein COQ10, mitochondrial isoform X2 n=1 Tax=Bactrocera dorsalis TaxID=27457 RepID=A0A6I9VIG8_BACDO|nr:coenzyme Q-binding protein COQ10, mitochondrial isoform X2 [Bactrocera dorsalis]
MLKNAQILLSNTKLVCCSCKQLSCTAAGGILNYAQRAFFTFSDLTNKNREYVKKELIGQRNGGFKADLIVGFPPLSERYTSNVSLSAPNLVKSVCNDGRLFNFLLNDWRFSPGLKDIPQSCVVDFKVAFEFKSRIHSNIANIFFDLICDQMEHAFVAEAERRYGPPSIKSHILSWRRS